MRIGSEEIVMMRNISMPSTYSRKYVSCVMDRHVSVLQYRSHKKCCVLSLWQLLIITFDSGVLVHMIGRSNVRVPVKLIKK